MNQRERRIFLIQKLLDENSGSYDATIPENEEEQKRLLRSLLNVRPPKPVTSEFLSIQDEYLSCETRKKGIVDVSELQPIKKGGRLYLWQGDITRLQADAIVNAANSAMLGCFRPCHSCIDNIIHTYAGIQLRWECSEIMRQQGYEEPAGRAKITSGYNLPCRYVLHTVGPIITGDLRETDCRLLSECYRSCLEIASLNQVRSIVFCCISTGVFCFPKEKAAKIAVDTVSQFLHENDTICQVIFDVFTEEDLSIYRSILLDKSEE